MSLSKKDLRKRAKLEKMGIDVMSMNEPGDNSRKEKKRKMQDAAINDGIPDSGDEEWNGLDARSRRIIKARILMNKRDKARDESNFALSDAIREKLKGMGIEVKDQKNGPSGMILHFSVNVFSMYQTICVFYTLLLHRLEIYGWIEYEASTRCEGT